VSPYSCRYGCTVQLPHDGWRLQNRLHNGPKLWWKLSIHNYTSELSKNWSKIRVGSRGGASHNVPLKIRHCQLSIDKVVSCAGRCRWWWWWQSVWTDQSFTMSQDWWPAMFCSPSHSTIRFFTQLLKLHNFCLLLSFCLSLPACTLAVQQGISTTFIAVHIQFIRECIMQYLWQYRQSVCLSVSLSVSYTLVLCESRNSFTIG